ncbi:MAG: anthranilate synthase component I family protein [Deltaproteobacteria bacterium]|jgi:anthranilate synthase component 1|nr:anthranilate synthase component I family protein [Deltaproteobacteria bacterium]
MIELSQKASFLESDVATPISVFLGRVGAGGAGVLLESAEVGGRWGRHSLVCAGAVLLLRCEGGLLELEYASPTLAPLSARRGMPFLDGLRAVMRDLAVLPDPRAAGLPPLTRALYGYLGYNLVGLMEPRLAGLVDPKKAEAALVLPASVLLFDHAYNTLTELSLGLDEIDPARLGVFSSAAGAPPAPEPAGAADASDAVPAAAGVLTSPSREEYMRLAAGARELIGEGELIQLVLSVGFESPHEGTPFDVYRRLRRLNPSPYMFYLQGPGSALVVSSPEVMVSCAENRLRLCPIAGTRPRGQDPVEDDLFVSELADDPKERAEHVMLVDLGRNDLGRVARPGTVTVDRFMEVERFSHVMHLTSHLGADLAPGLDAVDVVRATFPAGTLSGAPKIRAMELIAKMEGADRGPYGGAMGWLGLDKGSVSLDLGITIRGMWTDGTTARFRAGAGIVFDSDPAAEWAECRAKAAAVMAALRPADKGGENASSHR